MKRKQDYKQKQAGNRNAPKSANVSGQEKWKYYVPLAIILFLSFIAYLPVLHNGLLDWDDDVYIKNNPLIYSLNLKEIFSHNVQGNYHPFTILTLAIEYRLFGLNATGYHAVNLLLHLLNVILVFYTVYLLSDKLGVALVASLLFSIHPMHVESVAWASELKDLLYTFFFLASYIFYLKYLKDRNNKFYVYALLLFLASILSKAMAASLPVVLILTDYFKGRKIDKTTILEKAPFFILALAFGVVAIFAQKLGETIPGIAIFTFPQRILFASYGFMTYLFKLLMPLNLCAIYPYPVRGGVSIPIQYYLYLLAFLGLAACIIYSHRFTKKIIFGMGFFTATVLLVLQLLPVGNAMMADRYSYIPSIGIFYLAGEGFNLLWTKKLKLATFIILSAFTIFFSIKTYARCGVWKNDMTLWNDVISQYQTIENAYNSRGKLFAGEKRNAEAFNDFNKAIELNPNYFQAYYNRAILFTNEKRNDEALIDFNKSIQLNPGYILAYNNRGLLFMNAKRNAEALNDFNKIIELNPGFPMAFFNRGNLFYTDKRYQDAISNYTKAIALKTDYADAYFNRGLAEFYCGNKDDACKDLKQAAGLGYKQAVNALSQLCK